MYQKNLNENLLLRVSDGDENPMIFLTTFWVLKNCL